VKTVDISLKTLKTQSINTNDLQPQAAHTSPVSHLPGLLHFAGFGRSAEAGAWP